MHVGDTSSQITVCAVAQHCCKDDERFQCHFQGLPKIMLKNSQFITVCKGDMNYRKPKTAKISLGLNLRLHRHMLNSC